MSTHCRIGIEESDGRVTYAYLLKRTGTWGYAMYPDTVLNPLRAAVAQIPIKR